MNIKAVIFDLDDTLFDSTNTMTPIAKKEAAKVFMKYAPKSTEKEIIGLMNSLYPVLHSHDRVFSIICEKLNIENKEKVTKEAELAFNNSSIEGISLFHDVKETLAYLRENKIKIIILTTGNKERQQRKIAFLNLSLLVDEIIINNPKINETKKQALKEILERHKLKPKQVVMVGDRIHHEIAPANSLKINTVRILKGKYADQIPKTQEETPTFTIKEISDIKSIIPTCKSKN